MAKQTINIGSVPNDGTGNTLREGGDLINDNFNEIYTAIGDGTTLTSGTYLTTTNSETVQNKSIDGTQNTLSNIANASITNSTISIGGITFNLGDTDATPAIDLSDATNYPTSSLTGTITNTQLAGSIENAKLLNSTVSIVADDSSAQSISLGGSILFTGGSGITTSISGNEITFATDGSVVTESSSDVLTNKTINGPDNTLTNIPNSALDSIANAKLVNSSITIGADTIALGDTQTTITDLNLDGTSSLSGTGTIDLTGAGSKARYNFAGFGSLPTAATYEGMFAYDTVGQVPYVADSGGWTRLQTENDSISVHSDVNLTGIADGYVLQWSSAQARFNVVANTGGLSDVVDDTTPQLGGDLDAQGNYVQDVGYVSHRSPDATVTQTLTVTVASKTSEHTAFGDGSSNGYLIDGHEGAHLDLSPGVYKFDQADSSNSGHPLRFYDTAGKNAEYTTNVTTAGTPGSSGAYTQITISKSTPSTLHYQCTSHANMGGVVSVLGSENPRITENIDATFSSINLTGDINEKITTSATAATGTVNFDVVTQNVLYYTTNASADWTLNIRGDSSTTLDSIMDTGQACTIAFLVTQGGTAYYNNALTIDGSSVTPKYRDGSAYTSGNASGIDLYTYTIIKTGSATFTVLASQTQYA